MEVLASPPLPLEYEKGERETYSERGWICVWSMGGWEDLVVCYIYTSPIVKARGQKDSSDTGFFLAQFNIFKPTIPNTVFMKTLQIFPPPRES